MYCLLLSQTWLNLTVGKMRILLSLLLMRLIQLIRIVLLQLLILQLLALYNYNYYNYYWLPLPLLLLLALPLLLKLVLLRHWKCQEDDILTIKSIHLHFQTIPDMPQIWNKTNMPCRYCLWKLVLVNCNIFAWPVKLLQNKRKDEVKVKSDYSLIFL